MRPISRGIARVAMVTACALIAASCTGTSTDGTVTTSGGTEDTPGTSAEPATTDAGTNDIADPAILPLPPNGPLLSAINVEPPVAMAGEEVTVVSPFAGRLTVTGPDGSIAEAAVSTGPAGLMVPAGTTDGEYLITVRGESQQLGLGALRVASEPGIWVNADRLSVTNDQLVRVRVTALGMEPDTAVMIGLGEGWEAELSWDDEGEPDDASDDLTEDSSGPVGTLTATEEGLLIDTGLGETTLLSDLTGRDLFLPGTSADALQLVIFGDQLQFSDVLPLARCNDPATVVGSIGGPGGVRFVAASGDLESVASITPDGSFNVELDAGPHLLTGWLDGEPPTRVGPIPLEVPCGGTVRIGDVPAEPPPADMEPPFIVEDAFSVAQPACRTLVVTAILGPDDVKMTGLTQAVAGALRATLPRSEVIVAEDIEAVVDLAFDPLWSIRPGMLVHLGGLGERFGGAVYVTGVRHELGGTLASTPATDGDLAVARRLQDTSVEWVSGFASDVAASALCIEAAPLHLAAGEATEWPVTVTDLAGKLVDGAEVEVVGAAAGDVEPSSVTVASAPAMFTYTAGPETAFEGLTVHASMPGDGPRATATFTAGSGFTYMLIGRRRIGTADGEGILPLFGDLGFDLLACSPRPGGPYNGWFIVYDAKFLAISTAMTGLVGGMLATAAAAPAGQSSMTELEAADQAGYLRLVSSAGDAGLQSMAFEGGAGAGAPAGLMGWVFGSPNPYALPLGLLMLRVAADALNGIVESGTMATEGILGRIEGARFRRGEIRLLSSSEGSLVGTLNRATGLVGVSTRGGWGDGTWIMSAAVAPTDRVPADCGLGDATEADEDS